MKILFVIPYTPTPIRTRPYNLLRNLAQAGHQVSLATIWEDSSEQEALQEYANQGIKIISAPLRKSRIVQNLTIALLNRSPLQSYYSWNPEIAKKIVETLIFNQTNFDIIHVEHLRGAQYGLYLKTQLARQAIPIPVVWDSVDNISALFEQAARQNKVGFGRWVTRFELPRTRRYEASLINRFERILVTSPLDRMAFENLAANKNILTTIDVLTNGVDLETFVPSSDPPQSDTLVFSGKLSYHANVASALFLVQQVMPFVWQRRPQVRLQLVGKDPHPHLQHLSQRDSRIEVTGTVPDIQRYLQQASAAAATLLYGAGVQNKVLEAMACQTPVVATSRAISALQVQPGQDVLVADEPADLAEHFLNMLENFDYRQEIAKNGLRYVRMNHDWKMIVNQLQNIYEDVISHHSKSKLPG